MELSMHRVLMISATFPPFNVSGSQRAFQFAKYLPEYGYLPSVVSAEPGPMDPVDPSLLEQLDGRIRLERIQHLAPKIKPLLLALLRPVARCVRALLAAPADEPKLAAAPTAEFTVSGEPTFPSESVPLLGRMWHTMAWLFNFHVDIALPMLQRAVKYMQKGEGYAAQGDYLRYLKHRPKDADAHAALARAMILTKDDDGARKHYKSACELLLDQLRRGD